MYYTSFNLLFYLFKVGTKSQSQTPCKLYTSKNNYNTDNAHNKYNLRSKQ